MMHYLHHVFGLATYIPGINILFMRGGGSTHSARYCYSVWMRHLITVHKYGRNGFPRQVAELGPGASIGIGLAALLSGVEKYYAFDVVNYIDLEKNISIFDELVDLFQTRKDIPGVNEFPKVKPQLENWTFPEFLLDNKFMEEALNPERIKKIRDSILTPNAENSMIRYQVPWYDSNVLEKDSIDLIYSQAVLEHVDDLPNTYKSMALWLKSGCMMSHHIAFDSHRTAKEWNGHWTYSDFRWKLIKGNRPYLLNREPFSTHIRHLTEHRLKILHEDKTVRESKISKSRLAGKYKTLTDEDLITSDVYILAQKP